MSKRFGVVAALGITLIVGCSSSTEEGQDVGESEAQSAPLRTDCSVVLCALPKCLAGQILVTKKNECCPVCVTPKKSHGGSGGNCTPGCASDEHCDVCRTIDGPAYVCLPDGAVC